MAAQQNNLPVLYPHSNSFLIRDVHGEFGLINVHSLDILPAISSRKSGKSRGFFSVWRVVTPRVAKQCSYFSASEDIMGKPVTIIRHRFVRGAVPHCDFLVGRAVARPL